MNFLLNLFSSSFQELWKAIIRPYRDDYSENDLGPQKFRLNQKYYKRSDFSLINKRNLKLMCSYWEPYDEQRDYPRLPCVIYLHGNSSSRCEVVPNLKYLLPLNITVFAFDFAGCGHSEGEYISLGWYEVFDIQCVIHFLRNSKKVSTIGLWGRSMGAITSIMYASREQNIAGIFLDSPFCSLNLLIDELSKEKVSSLPNFLVKQVIKVIKETVKEKANFNIDDIETIEFAKKCFVPAFFCHGKDDTFVNFHHCKDLYSAYPGEKNILLVDGDHNSLRPNKLNENASEFFYNALKCKYIKEINDSYHGHKLFFRDWNNPKFRTPKGDNKHKIKKSFTNNEDNLFDDDIYEPKKNISKKYINKSNNFNYKKNDENENYDKYGNISTYKYKKVSQSSSNNPNINKIETINYSQKNNYNNKYRTNDNFNISINKNDIRPSLTKDVFDYNTYNRPKMEPKTHSVNQVTNSKISQYPDYLKTISNFESNIYKEQNNNINKEMTINTQNINNINKPTYNNNQIYNNQYKNINFDYYNINSTQKEIPLKKEQITQVNQNKIMRNYISPQNKIRYPKPTPTISYLNQGQMNPSYIYNSNNTLKNEDYISFNNDDNNIYNNKYYNKDNIQINTEYYNINNIYSTEYNISNNQSQNY